MSKIICEICGTAYPDTAESCPICGYTQDLGLDEMIEEDIQVDVPIVPKSKGTRPAAGNSNKKNKEIFDYDEANSDEEVDEDESFDDEEDEEEEESRSNPFLVVFLVILIVLLLAAAGFIFFKFFLPNMGSQETLPPVTTTAPAVTETEAPTTEAPTIPCTNLAIVGGLDVLAVEGQNFLLDIQVMPADTTDKVIFISEDESVVTVDENGKITAVGEGKTVINIICGKEQIACPVTVDYSQATEATESDETVPPVEGGEEAAESTEAATEETVDTSGIVLKLKQEDVMLMVPYSFQIELDCDLKLEDIEWSVEHDYICKVDDKGYVTALRSGTTAVIAKFGNQEVQCIVRCYMG